ncbi:MAG: hypothetical protein N3G80_04300 [Candidatus Micrarchaeota archaeon]|nr:hypothetical protein [Candidatus Micrarchaeota archaeon]
MGQSMCKPNSSKAFYSFDAAFALLFALMIYLAFSSIIFLVSEGFSSYADSYSMSAASARISFLILDKMKKGEFDFGCEKIRKQVGLSYLRAEAHVGDQEFISEAGSKGKQLFCTSRLFIFSGKVSKLVVCVS